MVSKSGSSTQRFAVGKPEGPRSNIWVLFTGKKENDIYISMRNFADLIKLSLHKSGSWQWAITKEYASGPSPVLPASGDRMLDKWECPPEFAPGWVKAFQVFVPSSEVIMSQNPEANSAPSKKKIHWVPRAADGFGTCFTVLISGPRAAFARWEAYPEQDQYAPHPIWHAALPREGKTVWVLMHEQSIPEKLRGTIEANRQEWHQYFKRENGATYDALTNKRGFLYSTDQDGTRSFIDIAMPTT